MPDHGSRPTGSSPASDTALASASAPSHTVIGAPSSTSRSQATSAPATSSRSRSTCVISSPPRPANPTTGPDPSSSMATTTESASACRDNPHPSLPGCHPEGHSRLASRCIPPTSLGFAGRTIIAAASHGASTTGHRVRHDVRARRAAGCSRSRDVRTTRRSHEDREYALPIGVGPRERGRVCERLMCSGPGVVHQCGSADFSLPARLR
jgi:hypothetical protein